MARNYSAVLFCLILTCLCGVQAADLPHFRAENGVQQLVVQGKPFLIRGGELGNSSAGTSAQADIILPEMARMQLNTVLMPLAWEQVEPEEGVFDFRILDRWIDVARRQNLRLVLLWFGSWKNAFSEYAPAWVKADTRRFPRARSTDGTPLEILSTFGTETLRLEGRTFAAAMAHLREKDQEKQTVLMVQVENEMGYLGPGRDRAGEANKQFDGAVPPELVRGLLARRTELSPELAAHFNSHGTRWREVFGDAAGPGRKEGIPAAHVCERATPIPHGTARRVSKWRAASVLSRGISRRGARYRFLRSRYLLAGIRILGEEIPDPG
jgi:hypothetical protein